MTNLFDAKQYHKEYYLKHKDKLNKQSKEYYKNNRDRQLQLQKDFAYKRKYGISQEEVDALFIKQKGRCAICNQTYHRTLHVDHNHVTGKVRGLLCKTCNTHLGTYEKHKEAINGYLNEN